MHGRGWESTSIQKLVVSYLLGDRGRDSAFAFILDCAERITGRPQLTTDALKVYPDAVEEVFGSNVDYAQLHKIYGAPTEEDYRRYSPARCIGCDMKTVQGRSRPETRLDQLRGAKQFNHAHVHAALHSADKCVLEKVG